MGGMEQGDRCKWGGGMEQGDRWVWDGGMEQGDRWVCGVGGWSKGIGVNGTCNMADEASDVAACNSCQV